MTPGGGPNRSDRALAGQVIPVEGLFSIAHPIEALATRPNRIVVILSTCEQPGSFVCLSAPHRGPLKSAPRCAATFSPPSCSPGRIPPLAFWASSSCTGGNREIDGPPISDCRGRVEQPRRGCWRFAVGPRHHWSGRYLGITDKYLGENGFSRLYRTPKAPAVGFHRAWMIKLEEKFAANEMPYGRNAGPRIFRFRRNSHLGKVIVLQQFYQLGCVDQCQGDVSVSDN